MAVPPPSRSMMMMQHGLVQTGRQQDSESPANTSEQSDHNDNDDHDHDEAPPDPPAAGSGKPTSRKSSTKASTSSPSVRRTAATSSRKSQAADGGLSRRSRPRASLACMHCRQRKVKCDMNAGRTPCSSCAALRIECVISRDGDRRKAGSREQVTALQDRVQFLESLVSGNRSHDPLQDPRASQHHRDASTAPTSTPSASRQIHPPRPALDNVPSSASADATAYQRAANMDPIMSSMNVPEHNGRWSQRHASAPQLHGQALSATPSAQGAFDSSDGRLTPPSEKDATRLDVDTDSSSLRFYGPSSQLHVQSRVPADDDEPSLAGHMSFEVDMDSEPVRQSLLQIFWKTHHLSQPLVVQYWFESGKATARRSEYFSSFLENTMLACASRMSTSADIRALGSKYAERAAAEIAQELQWPNIATLQGYLLLSDFESTRGRNRLGYMYCGMGCRLLFDLGIGENCSTLIAQGTLKPEEAVFRQKLLLATFVYDRLWGYYLGRPCAIPDSYIAAAERNMQFHNWERPPRFDAWVGLCQEITEATELLNSAAPPDVEGMARLVDLDNRILHRMQNLHPALALDEERPSQLGMDAYGIHVQILGLRIVLHRTLSKAVSHNGHAAMGIPSPQDNNNINRSRAIMYENSMRIARLISMYRQLFGVENIITIMLDGLFIASQWLSSHILQQLSENPEQDMHWLRTMADTLAKAQKHYPVTARMRSTLSGFVEKSPLDGIFGHWAVSNVTPSPGHMPSDQQGPVTMQSVEIFGQHTPAGFMHHHAGQDVTLMEGAYGDFNEMEMDYRHPMSWMLSPPG